MMMIHTTTVFFLLTAALLETADAFNVVVNRNHVGHNRRSYVTTATAVKNANPMMVLNMATDDNEDTEATLAKLQLEYKLLQERLLSDIVIKHDEEDAIRVEERMIEVAAEASEIERQEITSDVQQAKEEAISSIGHLDHDFKEILAMHKSDAAKILLEQLETNEIKLAATQARLKKEEKKHEDTAQQHAEHHRSFLDRVKDTIYAHPDLLASMDPHIL